MLKYSQPCFDTAYLGENVKKNAGVKSSQTTKSAQSGHWS